MFLLLDDDSTLTQLTHLKQLGIQMMFILIYWQHFSSKVPVKVWAVAGGAVLMFIAWVLLRWVTGPYFRRPCPAVPATPLGG